MVVHRFVSALQTDVKKRAHTSILLKYIEAIFKKLTVQLLALSMICSFIHNGVNLSRNTCFLLFGAVSLHPGNVLPILYVRLK